jgi:hypothetical protein
VVAGNVMAFGGGSGGEVSGPSVGLCVVASGSLRCGSGSSINWSCRACCWVLVECGGRGIDDDGEQRIRLRRRHM